MARARAAQNNAFRTIINEGIWTEVLPRLLFSSLTYYIRVTYYRKTANFSLQILVKELNQVPEDGGPRVRGRPKTLSDPERLDGVMHWC